MGRETEYRCLFSVPLDRAAKAKDVNVPGVGRSLGRDVPWTKRW